MTTKEYVLKYELNKNAQFSHNEFVSDLTNDFASLLEVGKGNERIKGFDNAVRAIKMKWDAINNKTVGQLPEKLWNFFYATVIVVMKKNLFPQEMKRQEDERKKRKRQYDNRMKWEHDELHNNGWSFNDFLLSMMFARKQAPVSSFTLLGLSTGITVDDVKTVYKKLSMTHHPDKGGKQDKFIAITEAKNECLKWLETNTY